MAQSTSYIDDETNSDSYLPVGPEEDPEQVLTPEYTRISSPPPEARVFGTPVSASPAGLAPPTPAETARTKAADIAGQRPQRPKPGFWRNLAAIGAGFGAGYSNATGKPNMPQVDVGAVMDNVKYGDYNRKVHNWAEQENDAALQAEQLGKAEAEQKANAAQASTANYQNAGARHLDALSEALQYEKADKPYVSIGPRGTLNTSTGQIIGAPGPAAPKEPTNAFEAGLRTERARLGRDLTLPEIAEVHKQTGGTGTVPNVPPAQLAMRAAGKTTGVAEIDALTAKEAGSVLDRNNPEKPDPFALIGAREDAIDARTQQRATDLDRHTDQRQITDLQNKEQQLHTLRGALGRELSKADTAPANDPQTGRPVIDAKKKAVLVRTVRESLQNQYDQATKNAAELHQQQVALAERNRPPPSAEAAAPATVPAAVPVPSRKVKVYNPATGGWK